MAAAVDTGAAASLSVAVAVDGQVLWQEAVGWADRGRQIRATARTRYAVASVTKPMTALAVLSLAERGQLDLDAPVNRWLGLVGVRGGAAGDPNRATIRLLLQHRSGLPEQNRYHWHGASRRPPLDSIVARYAFLENEPSSRYGYSNLGYAVLERAIERASGKAFPDFMREDVFLPIGMHRSTVGPRPGETALLYDADGGSIPFYDLDSRGSGGVYATAEDVLRFGLFHMERARGVAGVGPISPAGAREMIRSRQSTGRAGGEYGPDWYYGLGWGGRDSSELSHDWYGHEGSMPGVSSILRMVPSRRIAVVVLSNSRQELTYSLADAILDALIEDFPARRRRDAVYREQARLGPRPAAVRLPQGRWTGVVNTPEGAVSIELRLSEEEQIVRIGDSAPVLLEELRVSDGRISARARTTIPAADARGEHSLRLVLHPRGSGLQGIIVADAGPPLYSFWLPHLAQLRRAEPGAVQGAPTERERNRAHTPSSGGSGLAHTP